MKNNRLTLSLICTLAPLGASWAQQSAPDAGRILQQVSPAAPTLPQGGKVPALPLPQVSPPGQPGGDEVTLQGIRFTGNTVFDERALLAVIGPLKGQSFDLAGLEKLVNQITAHYRQAGYPFATAYLPEQNLQDNVLRIEIVEGRYGQVQVKSDDAALVTRAQAYLSPLQPGQLIRQAPLERAILLLGDLPGVAINPVLSPGADHGQGDMMVELQRQKAYRLEIGLDNYGGYYSGMTRGRISLAVDSPFMLGDQFTAQALHTNADLWMGNVNYSAPLNAGGWRANAGYTHTRYQLGRDFVGSEGTAKVASVGASYALMRSLRTNIVWSANIQDKRLFNSNQYGAATERYQSQVLPIAILFDRVDDWGGFAGGLTWSIGRLDKDDEAKRGSFQKLNIELSRAQNLGNGFSLFGRYSKQTANKNLDSSERMSLGGVAGVRAYAASEGFGDEGWLTQLEMRYTRGAATTYTFYDYGHIKIDAKPALVDLPSPDVKKAGVGFGLRYQATSWVLDAALAWRTVGGVPTSEGTRDPKPRAWMNFTYKF